MNPKKTSFPGPVSFTIVMGTGVFSISCLEMASVIPGLRWLAWFLNILNYCLFFVLAIWAFAAWSKNAGILRENFNTPAGCALYSACGIALLVLGAQALRFGFGDAPAIFFWSCGALLTIGLNFAIMLRFFLHPGLEISHITPVFFVPVAGLVVVPVAGAPISMLLHGFAGDVAIMVCILSLGGGLALYAGLFSIMLQRHLLTAPLPDQLAPTFWIHMAPTGWAGVSLTAFAQYILEPEYAPAAMLAAMLLFGASLWWLVMVAAICLKAAKSRTLSFSLSWWAFVFPIGSVALLAKNLAINSANIFFPFFWVLLGALWLLCACKTLLFCRNMLFR